MPQTWKLDDVLTHTGYETLLNLTVKRIAKFKTNLIHLLSPNLDLTSFQKSITELHLLQENINRLYGYGMLLEATDQTNGQAKYFKSSAKNVIILYEDATREYYHWLKGKKLKNYPILDSINAKRLFDSVPQLSYTLQRMRNLAKRSLKLFEEEIITKKTLNGISVLQDLRTQIDTEQNYKFINPKSKKIKIYHNVSALLANTYSKNQLVRKNTYASLLESYKKNINKYFLIYEAVIKDWNDEMKWRKYDSAISIRNEANDITDIAVEKLIQVCRENQHYFQEYFRLKAKILKLPKLNRYDIYAPIRTANDSKIEFNSAKNTVLKLFNEFDTEFAEFAKSIFTDSHIDSHPNPKKQSGAFCATISPQIKPYVMLNYTDRQRDMLIMAHELGHAVHARFAEKLPVSVQEAPLTLAETASTFSEMLVFDHLYNKTTDKNLKKQMLLEKIAETYATINRQIYFVIFEQQAHQAVPQGIALDDFNNLYYSILKEQFGTSINLGSNFKYEWSYIPHIVNTPFYCYSYSFGELLSLNLYNTYVADRKAFIPKFKTILKSGGSKNPTELLKQNGFDIEQAEFWQTAFHTIKFWINELIKLS